MIYLNLIGSLLIGSSVMINNMPEPPDKPVIEKTCWVLIEEDETLTIYERWISFPDGTKTRERKGVFSVKSETKNIIPFISKAEGIEQWMKGVEEASELPVHDSLSKLIYIEFNAPWPFKDRDLVSEIRTNSDCDSVCIEVFMSAVTDCIPEKSKTIRMKSYEAHWQIIQLGNGEIRIEFSAYSATPPIAPLWIQDPVTLKLFKDNLMNLNELLTLND